VPPSTTSSREIQQRDLGLCDGKSAAVEVPAGPDAEIEVARADVALVPLEHRRARTPPGEAVRETEDDEVVRAEDERRVDALPARDVV
jgi:hypothetical protein